MLNPPLVRVVAAVAVLVAGCTSIKVQPVDPSVHLNHVCIQKNPKVEVSDFVPVIRARLDYHSITSEVFTGTPPASCEFILTYTALRSWDLTLFLSHAELYLSRDDQQIGSGVFHLVGKGGYALTKYNGTATKMNPVVDQLVGSAAIDAN